MTYLRTLRLLTRTFKQHPRGARLHVLIRFLTCPFLRTLDSVKQGVRILDIGAGHGIFAALAMESGADSVVAVEPDLRKSFLPFPIPSVRFVGGFDDSIRGTFDVVVIYDATYRIPVSEREGLFQRAFDRVRPGGLFVLKDLDPEARLKFAWARMQEFISDHLLGVSLGEGFVYDTRAEVQARMERAGFVDFRSRRVDRGYPHSHIVYTSRKPE
ncbi:MAG TPA: methyltransferase domain-containing protein [Thermoanaerobaculia bacterium]|nr:methyltransferase domain-containing protein [Thermoanaerobaculia bacterium]